MLDALKTLFESNVISNDIKESIEQAWDAKVLENREHVSQLLREEFAQKYEHDKQVMAEAIDRMVTDQLSTELVEFAEDRKQLAEMKIKYAKKMAQDATTLKEFVTRQLASELSELHEDQKQMAGKFGTLENFIVEALAREITDFYQDKKDLAETKVKVLREGREEIKRIKQEFVQRAAVMVESALDQNLRTELTALKEDIEAARRSEFGRKLFEAFAAEYQTSYLNERSETAKLLKVIDTKDMAMQEAAEAVVKAEQIISVQQSQIQSLKESVERTQVMNDLLAPLSKEQKMIMSELLEGTKTSKLTESFEKYLPAVISGNTPQKRQPLVEAKEITGNKTSKIQSEEESNIFEIRRLAGIKI